MEDYEEKNRVDFGCDLDDSFEIDPLTGDFKLVHDDDNADQGIRNRLLTSYDELAELGYYQYGNNAKYFLKITDIDLLIPHIEIYTKQALDRDARVEEVLEINSVIEDNVLSVHIRVMKVNDVVSDLEAIRWDVFTGENINE